VPSSALEAPTSKVAVYGALMLAVMAVSTAAPLVHAAAPAPAMTVAALRISLAALLLTLGSGADLGAWRHLAARQRGAIALAGTFLAAHFGVWISSLYLTSTAASVALVATQPVFAALFGRIFLGETILVREVGGIAVAGLGCVVLAGGDLGVGDALFGDVLAILGAAFAAAYLVVGRRLRAALALRAYLAYVNLIASVLLLGAAALMDAPLAGLPWSAYAAIAACAVVPSLLGHTLLNWSVRRVAAHVVALAILGEPVGASLIQWAVHGEAPPGHAILGGAVIVAGIGIGFARR